MLSKGFDTAGVGIAFARAFNRNGHEARAVRRWPSPYGHPADVVWTQKNWPEVKRLFFDADVVHVIQTPSIVRDFPRYHQKRIVVAHLGTHFRDRPELVSRICREVGADETVMSHELLAIGPHAALVPNPVDLDYLASLRSPVSDRYIRIAHAPTNRETKGTAAFLAATERLMAKYPLIVDVIEGVSYEECIRRKAQADILYDQTELGYGLNAVEAWAMGIPVVAGLANPVARKLFTDDWGDFPYVDATPDTLYDALERLIDPAERRAWGERGRAFAEQHHSERSVVARALAVYERQAVAA